MRRLILRYSQHLGQGANQAFEDVSTLTELLYAYIPPSALLGRTAVSSTLSTVFDKLDACRIPRTSALVRGAREMGRQRVLPSGSKDAEERDRQTKEDWSCAEEKILERYETLLGPRK